MAFRGAAKRKCNSGKSMSGKEGGREGAPLGPHCPLPPFSAALPTSPLSSDVYRVKLPPRYSSNFRSDEAARNCNDVFGRLTYRLGNLFIRIARRAPGEMYGIVGNLQTPLSLSQRETETSAVCVRVRARRWNKNREWKWQGSSVSHRRYKNTSSMANASIVTRVAVLSIHIRDRSRPNLRNISPTISKPL